MDLNFWLVLLSSVILLVISLLAAISANKQARAERIKRENDEAERRLPTVREYADRMSAAQFHDSPVIWIPSYNGNPLIGFVEHIDTEKGVVTYIHDYIEDETKIVFGFPMHYTDMRWQVFAPLTPRQRWSVYHHAPHESETQNFDNREEVAKVVYSVEEIHQRLLRNGFYDRLLQKQEQTNI